MADEQSSPAVPEQTQNMDLWSDPKPEHPVTAGKSNGKRAAEKDETIGGAKLQKVGEETVALEEGENGSSDCLIELGPKQFGSSVEMFFYFQKLMHFWPTNLDVNKYEQMVLLDLIRKGHLEPDRKVGSGIQAFQVRNHPLYKSRCFFLVRGDETIDDFSFKKCVDHIRPLPENFKAGGAGAGAGVGGRRGGRRCGWRGKS